MATDAWAGESWVAKPAAPTVSVRLKANPSTGYQWVLIKYDSRLLETPTSHYVSSGNMPGAPGYMVWEFTVKNSAFTASQKTAIILEYKRPWEKSAGERQIIEINIQMR